MTYQLVTTINDHDTINDIVQDMENLSASHTVARWAHVLDRPRSRSGIFMGELPVGTHVMRGGPYVMVLWDGHGTAALFVETMHSSL